MQRFALLLCVIVVCALIGCSSAGKNVTAPEQAVERATQSDNSHVLWGIYQFTADPVAKTLEITPIRSAEMHLNALPFLEPPPLLHITLESLEFNGNIIEVDIGLRHPFLGLTEFTGFDVCGIFISSGSFSGYADSDINARGIRRHPPAQRRRLLPLVESDRIPANEHVRLSGRPSRHARCRRRIHMHIEWIQIFLRRSRPTPMTDSTSSPLRAAACSPPERSAYAITPSTWEPVWYLTTPSMRAGHSPSADLRIRRRMISPKAPTGRSRGGLIPK